MREHNDNHDNDVEENERRRIPRNNDPYYPEAYHIADHTPDEEEGEQQ